MTLPDAAVGARFLVAGRVQGVGFRAATRARARALGLGGHAINLDDGRVEVIASGSSVAIDRLEAWLRQGPPGARVDRIEREAIESKAMDDFGTR